MNREYKIKQGLHCTIKTHSIKKCNNSFLVRINNIVSLSCHFSKPDCETLNNDVPLGHDLEFVFHHDYLKNFSSPQQDFDILLYPEFQQHEICCNTQLILHEIVNCKLQGAFLNMFLESKALSLLLCFQKCSIVNESDCTNCKFLTNPLEKDKIRKAKEIILTRLNNPPTIEELSLQVGINQCYLKKGFKELFSTTVYDFIQEQRMMKAKLLFRTTDFTVSQVADKVGFASLSSFSAAYKKITGVFPSEMQLN